MVAVAAVAEALVEEFGTVALEPGCFRFFEPTLALGFAENVEVPGIPSLVETAFPLAAGWALREFVFADLSLFATGEPVRLFAFEAEDFFEEAGFASIDRSSSASISLLSSA